MPSELMTWFNLLRISLYHNPPWPVSCSVQSFMYTESSSYKKRHKNFSGNSAFLCELIIKKWSATRREAGWCLLVASEDRSTHIQISVWSLGQEQKPFASCCIKQILKIGLPRCQPLCHERPCCTVYLLLQDWNMLGTRQTQKQRVQWVNVYPISISRQRT